MTEAEPQAEHGSAPEGVRASDALQRAEAAFAAGDHARVRESLALVERAGSAEQRARAAQLARAISVDPALVVVLLVCLLGFVAVFVGYVLE